MNSSPRSRRSGLSRGDAPGECQVECLPRLLTHPTVSRLACDLDGGVQHPSPPRCFHDEGSPVADVRHRRGDDGQFVEIVGLDLLQGVTARSSSSTNSTSQGLPRSTMVVSASNKTPSR